MRVGALPCCVRRRFAVSWSGHRTSPAEAIRRDAILSVAIFRTAYCSLWRRAPIVDLRMPALTDLLSAAERLAWRERPTGAPCGYHRWHDLLFVHWRVP